MATQPCPCVNAGEPTRDCPCAVGEIERYRARARDLLAAAAERVGLTARGYHRVLRVARTVADLEGAPATGVSHVAEALRYRLPSRDSHLARRVTCAASRAGAHQSDRSG